MDDPDCGEHNAALSRYALLLTGDRARATDIVREAELRAGREPGIANAPSRSVRAWLFTVVRDMIVDEQPNPGWSDGVGSEEINAAVDRLLLADALAQLSAEHRAVVRRACYQRCTTAQMAADLHIAEATVKSRLHGALGALCLQLREMGVALP